MAKGGGGWRKAGGGWVGGADEDLLPGQLLLENLITGGYIVHVLHSLSGILYNLFPVLYFLSGIL